MKQKIFFIILGLAAIVSIVQGFGNALTYSRDFQWSPTVLFWEGINPYVYYLAGNEGNRIILSQAPNYAHLTYLILYPFSIFSWELAKFFWVGITLLLSLLTVKILSVKEQLSSSETFVVLCVFFCSTPLRNTMENGQHGILVLTFFCALLYQRNYFTNSLIGVSYFKYSFLPPIIFFITFRDGFKAAFTSLLACGIGWVFFFLTLNADPLEILVQPLKVSATAMGSGTADLMTIMELIFTDRDSLYDRIAVYGSPTLLSLILARYTAKINATPLFKLSFISITCLITFKHLFYDFILFLPAFVYAYKRRGLLNAKIAIALIFFNWFGVRFIFLLKIQSDWLLILNFLMGLSLLFTMVSINKNEPHLRS